MHGLRRELLHAQIEQLKIPCTTLELPENPDMTEYNKLMNQSLKTYQQNHYTHTVFGDIFLEELRKYREEKLASLHINAHFPLWKRNTRDLMLEFIRLGFKAIVVTVNAALLDKSFAGREIDESFLNDLPDNVDPCGENGEFHTFCFAGPIFENEILFEKGEIVYREYRAAEDSPEDDICTNESAAFWYCDLLPA